MKRRVNKSNKVPNVKLRPAQPGAVEPLVPTSSYWVQETQEDAQSNLQFICPRPFKGVVLCTTGNVDKPTLVKHALELGATSSDKFTDRVTHLVAAEHGSAKYLCAVERKIPILLPSWITESYRIWLKGDDVDLNASVASHRIPIFSGITVCPSGIKSITQRTKINNVVTTQGGTYVRELERPVKVTHLLCSGDTETDKMRYARKFNQRGEANIWLVWEEWLWDSLEFGGRFDEGKYLVNLPRPERKLCSAELHSQGTLASLSTSEQAQRADTPSIQAAHAVPQPDAYDESQLDEVPVNVKRRVPSETLQMWQSLLKSRSYEVNEGVLVRNLPPSQGTSKGKEILPVGQEKVRVAVDVGGSVIDAFRRSSVSVPQLHRETCSGRQSLKHVPTSRASPAPKEAESSSLPEGDAPKLAQLFVGMKFRALGEAKCATSRSAVETHGGRLVADDEIESEVDFIIVRLVSGSKIYRDEQDAAERTKYRTDCWLEGCIFNGEICSPTDHPSFLPLSCEIPIHGSETLRLAQSGLSESEHYWMERLARALGITLVPKFSRSVTHLLCPSRTGPKFEKAIEWGIAVVDMDWITQISIEGAIPAALPSSQEEQVASKSAKAKGKRNAIVDITNSEQATQDSFEVDVRSGDDYDSLFGVQSEVLTECQEQSHSVNSSPPPSTVGVTLDEATSPCEDGPAPPTLRELRERERDMATTSVPSSTSPSPMKVPGSSTRAGSASPVKVSAEATKALQDSITNLLGKRPSEDEDSLGSRQVSLGKRVRPPSKVKPRASRRSSRLKSDDTISSVHESLPPYAQPSSPAEHSGAGPANVGKTADESMTVMYEDPVQRDEKERLMNLVGNLPSAEEAETSVGRGPKTNRTNAKRRSTRIAGF